MTREDPRDIDRVVLVDDQVNTGNTARRSIQLLREHFGDEVRIFFVVLAAGHQPAEDGAGTSEALDVERCTWLFDREAGAELPWDTEAYRSSLAPTD